MDAGAPKAGGGRKAALPVPAAGTDAAVNAGAAPLPVPEGAAAAADDAPAAAAAAGAGSGGGGGEEDDDVQVERFYALLDSIRAMRGAYGAGDVDGDGAGAVGVEAGGGGGRKRLRAAEPPWRPAFRLEDFEEPSPTSSKRASRQEADAERPAAASPPPRRAGARLDAGRKSF